MSPAVRQSLSRYEHGAAAASALQMSLWAGSAKRSLGDEIATLIGIERPLSDDERGFFDRLEEQLSA